MIKIWLTTILGILLLLSPTKISAQYQGTTLYSEQNRGGTFMAFREAYVPDLRTFSFDNRAKSACVIGIWLFYDLPNYNQIDATMEYAVGENYCLNFQNLAGKVSSLRFAGSPKDHRLDSLTLYVGTYFQNEEEYTYTDLVTLNLDRRVSSLIVTGVTPWTLYDESYFRGQSVCVYPPPSNDFRPALIFDTVRIDVPHGTIRSVRRGCHAQRQVYSDTLGTGGLINVAETNNKVAVNHKFVDKA